MKKYKSLIKTVSVVLIMAVLASAMSLGAGANTVSQMQNKYKNLEQKQKELQRQIDQKKQGQEDQEEYQKLLNDQIQVIAEKITTKDREISETIKKIDLKKKEISAKQRDIEDTLDLFKERLRSMYMSGSDSLLEVLLSSESFAQFVSRTDMAERVSDHDRKMLEKLEKQKKSLERTKKSLDDEKKILEQNRNTLNDDRRQLNINYRKSKEYQDVLKHQQDKYTLDIEKTAKEMEKLDREIKAAIERAMKSSGKKNYVGGEFIWPVPGFASISSYFGEPRGSNRHWGMDIAGRNSSGQSIHGKSIIAANSGTVISVASSGVYGRYIMVDHGGGKVTLYAHCSSIAASVGQSVAKGQVIAYVGNTGFSTGSHLHFEIRINGAAVNPLNHVRYGG
ncbi:MAG: peptidoglycan DD-metalloendopeptidase family protein [Oscillospiraceae bacterium]|nr:peptidoglycan DD-metalloendopeptidase family protein [Oscillospiraceae bacterium]